MAYWRSLPIKEVSIGGFRGLDESVPAHVRPLGSLSAVSNLVLDPVPSLKTRPGLTALSTAISAAVTRGLHQYVNLAGTVVQTLAQAGTQLSYTTGTTWTSITAAAPAKAFTAANLNDLACLFYAGSAPQKWNGTTLSALAGTPPQGEFAVESHGQLFVAGIPTREGDVDFCDDEAPETWTVTPTNNAGSITISTAPIKWLGRDVVEDTLLIWTTRELYALTGPETPNRPALWEVKLVSDKGTPNGRTVQNVGGVWIWLTNNQEKGFAMWAGGEVKVIYLPIRTSVDSIDWSTIANAGSWLDERGRYNCSVPKSGGRTVFTYDRQTGEWSTGSNVDVRASGIVRVSGTDVPIVGDELGQIHKATGSDDAGTAISWSAVIGPSTLGEPFVQKEVTDCVLVLSLASGATCTAQAAFSETGAYGTAQTITATTTDLERVRFSVPVLSTETRNGTVFRLKVSGTGVVQLHDVSLTTYASGR